MANQTGSGSPHADTPGAWVKQYHLASQAVIESVLRPYGVGPSQWFVLYRLARYGPSRQRDLVAVLGIERATMTGIVGALVRKGHVEQVPDPADRRQKTLRLTDAGSQLWARMPDPIGHTLSVAFDGVDQHEQDLVVRVLRDATGRLTRHLADRDTGRAAGRTEG